MNKKIIAIIVAAVIASGAAGYAIVHFSGDKTTAPVAESTVTQAGETTTGEAVTEAVTEVVTDENGETVAVVVTDQNGEAVTEVVTEPYTGDSKNENAPAGKENEKTTAKGENTTKKNESTTKKTTTTTTTTQPVDNTIKIVLKKNRQAESSSSDVAVDTGLVTITKAGDYLISTETDDWHGQIIVKLPNTDKCELKFEGTGKISCDTKNIIQIIDTSITTDRTFLESEATAGTAEDDAIKEIAENEKAPNVDVSFPTGSDWTFQCSGNSHTGVIYNESKLTFQGNGKATFSAITNANNCVCSTKSITIKNVDLTMTTAQNANPNSFAGSAGGAKGIFSYSKIIMEGGSLTIKANGDAIRCDTLESKSGSMSLTSSACDGIDADDLINISGGSVTAIALQKHSFKVRRVNNEERAQEYKAAGSNVTVKYRVRAGKGDGFYINGGTVIGESKKISSLNPAHQSDGKDSSQASVTCKLVKENKGSTEETKVPNNIKIGTLNKTSTNKCIKYLFSSSSVSKGTGYKATAGNNEATVSWNGNFGCAEIISSTN